MNSLSRTALLAGLLLSLTLGASAHAQEVKLEEARQKMAAASAVRVRAMPQFSSSEVTRLKLGAVVTAVARSAEMDEIGGRKDYWYLVQLPAGGTGWVFGGLLRDYDAARRAEIVRGIVGERLKAESMSFDDATELYGFVGGALSEAKDPDAKAELELSKLLALGKAFATVPFDERERAPFREWFKAHEAEVVYSEPSGEYLVRSDLFWDLERKHHGTAVGERIAWAGAENPLPGECEGDEVCDFLYLSETQGKYLSLYPDGPHAAEVLSNLKEALTLLSPEDLRAAAGSPPGDKYLEESRDAVRKAVAELRAAAAKSSRPEKSAVIKRIDELMPPGR